MFNITVEKSISSHDLYAFNCLFYIRDNKINEGKFTDLYLWTGLSLYHKKPTPRGKPLSKNIYKLIFNRIKWTRNWVHYFSLNVDLVSVHNILIYNHVTSFQTITNGSMSFSRWIFQPSRIICAAHPLF